MSFNQIMPSKTVKIIFAVFTVIICIVIVVLAITLGMQDGDEVMSSGKYCSHTNAFLLGGR